jgi:hypothetical protein
LGIGVEDGTGLIVITKVCATTSGTASESATCTVILAAGVLGVPERTPALLRVSPGGTLLVAGMLQM